MDNGTIKEVRRCDVDFTPKLEDLVDVFEDKDQVIVTRRKEKTCYSDHQSRKQEYT